MTIYTIDSDKIDKCNRCGNTFKKEATKRWIVGTIEKKTLDVHIYCSYCYTRYMIECTEGLALVLSPAQYKHFQNMASTAKNVARGLKIIKKMSEEKEE